MVSDIDQFGRDTSKINSPILNEEKSKKILETLGEIKNQLENKDYNPNIDDSTPKIKISNSKNKSDLDEMVEIQKKIKVLFYLLFLLEDFLLLKIWEMQHVFYAPMKQI